MKILLKEFQEEAVGQFVRRLRQAAREARDGDLQAVSLSSPTGSGKTVMATAAIESIWEGDGQAVPNPDATFLWITDQPELNEQTRRKMVDTSSKIGLSRLVVVDASFDRETFAPGTVSFLNIQKLGKEKGLVTPGDDRRWTIWETIRATVEARPGAFFVLIDEAHRGMGETNKDQKYAHTIIQKFIKGSAEIPAVPLIIGISATPQRFNALIAGTSRTARACDVKAEDVRASGLLKERISLFHPDEKQPADMTMLRAAVRSWKTYTQHWQDYSAAQNEPPVYPIFVVQVEDAPSTSKAISKTDIGEVLRIIREEAGDLSTEAFAHAFQEGTSVETGGEKLRYLAPSRIAADPYIQIVFFKTSLNTGWDCPRAETMMSFRTAQDPTAIAQLVGRMVRTPLARRVDADEFLNSVALYLPHYDRKEVIKVIERLTSPDDGLPGVEVVEGAQMMTLARAPGREDVFALLAALPSYIVPTVRKTSQVKRLLKLGRYLANDAIDPDALDTATGTLLAVLNAAYENSKDTPLFRSIVQEKDMLNIRALHWQPGAEDDEQTETFQLKVSPENIEDLFEATGRKIGEGLHKVWWRQRVEEDPAAKTTAKLELFATCAGTDNFFPRLERTAREMVQRWLTVHAEALSALPDARRQDYEPIYGMAAEPEVVTLRHPEVIEVAKAEKQWMRHLFADEAGLYPFDAKSTWEPDVIAHELRRPETVAWLRNTERKSWALCLPYKDGGKFKPMYPDFLFVRQTEGGLVVDLLDPHATSFGDAAPKAVGLAQYAEKHGQHYGRIEMIIKDGDHLGRLNLQDEAKRAKVLAVTTSDELLQLFEQAD